MCDTLAVQLSGIRLGIIRVIVDREGGGPYDGAKLRALFTSTVLLDEVDAALSLLRILLLLESAPQCVSRGLPGVPPPSSPLGVLLRAFVAAAAAGCILV